ncbi:hypothetical protein Bhyg_03369 [Pseudolycoriella hygida]|uniref:Uncharacterized protein n=1 Tax=Pseudolycoriella hygida TaxID=35572 RepID=A0A9Q0S8P2_9DIPT|nr:hypothetical protein Bhyg_03369 [Pseudolycoriella hygida]
MDDPLATSISEEQESKVVWENVSSTFAPRKQVPLDNETELYVEETSTPSDLFF